MLMNFKADMVHAICQKVRAESASSLRACRLSRRQARLIEPELLSLDQAELHDLNQIVWSVVEEALPLCRALGIRLVLQQDPRLPVVPLLVRPIEDTLAAALDLCLDEEAYLVRVKTRARRNRVVTMVERWCRSPMTVSPAPRASLLAFQPESDWRDTGPMGQVELIVGDRTTRALGGKLSIQHRAGDLRILLELPIYERPQQTQQAGNNACPRVPQIKKELGFPGIGSIRQKL